MDGETVRGNDVGMLEKHGGTRLPDELLVSGGLLRLLGEDTAGQEFLYVLVLTKENYR